MIYNDYEIDVDGNVICIQEDGEKKTVQIQRDNQGEFLSEMVLLGGFEVGIMTNPDLKDRPNFVEINGEKVVCLAQAGECRQEGEFYSIYRINDHNNWKTPVASESCSDKCHFKYLVCEGHEHGDDEDVGIFIVNPLRNKFSGQFTRFCKDFKRIH